MTPPTNHALLRNVELLHDAAGRGEPAATATLNALKAKAAAGDLASLAAVNTFKVLGFQRSMPAEWTEAGIMHERLSNGDPHAEAWLNAVKASAVAGIPQASTTLDMLAAHNDKHYASAWARPDDGEDEDDNTRIRNVTPMTLAKLPRRRAYAVGNLIIGLDPSASVKSTSATAKAVAKVKFLKLTPEAEQQLVRMMLLGASSHAAGAAASAASPLANVAPAPAPEAAICARARDAVARNSPAAYALVQQCNLASGRQVLAPVAAPVANTTGVIKALGRTAMPTKVLGRTGVSTMSSATMGLQGICSQAASAKARNSPIYPQLLAKCVATRAANIKNGLFIADDLTPDMTSQESIALRVALDNAGMAIVNGSPKMQAFRASLPAGDRQRGFTMAMAVRAGQVDPKFVAFITPALAGSPDLLKGFVDAMNM